MLGSLARWLRAAGYDTFWQIDIDDWDLIRLALREGRVLLSSDTGIFRIGIVRDGEVAGLMVPHGLGKRGQLSWVLQHLHLPLRKPRCMACGGELRPVAKEQVCKRIPARTFAWLDEFEECTTCDRLFWGGTHWRRIAAELKEAERCSGSAVALAQPDRGDDPVAKERSTG